jgi:hypothetical protein
MLHRFHHNYFSETGPLCVVFVGVFPSEFEIIGRFSKKKCSINSYNWNRIQISTFLGAFAIAYSDYWLWLVCPILYLSAEGNPLSIGLSYVKSYIGYFYFNQQCTIYIVYFNNIYTGHFIMFSMITNIYNKKAKVPTLMELFTTTGKLKKFFLTTRDVRCVHHWWYGTHRKSSYKKLLLVFLWLWTIPLR